ncbi:MAG: hypothetical protein AVDCRST_MAG54-1476 [uncultured Actinomycetospora sp.]|uniref:Uncharacterized protein n=1 Tax=uncultured Actinomycetospora sp. TaxID=1135996 RepID=A0A6J4I219_9PSEU|nr:MAG: hypothetical protein AVDCRST_MAG54-1476 [uncultured Actinomycetospora sp.]
MLTVDPEPRVSRLAHALPLLLAALLAVAALGTVGSAGCDEPARYVSTARGIELVGGCLGPGDVHPVPRHPEAHDAAAERG